MTSTALVHQNLECLTNRLVGQRLLFTTSVDLKHGYQILANGGKSIVDGKEPLKISPTDAMTSFVVSRVEQGDSRGEGYPDLLSATGLSLSQYSPLVVGQVCPHINFNPTFPLTTYQYVLYQVRLGKWLPLSMWMSRFKTGTMSRHWTCPNLDTSSLLPSIKDIRGEWGKIQDVILVDSTSRNGRIATKRRLDNVGRDDTSKLRQCKKQRTSKKRYPTQHPHPSIPRSEIERDKNDKRSQRTQTDIVVVDDKRDQRSQHTQTDDTASATKVQDRYAEAQRLEQQVYHLEQERTQLEHQIDEFREFLKLDKVTMVEFLAAVREVAQCIEIE